jgi:hypothetical protein
VGINHEEKVRLPNSSLLVQFVVYRYSTASKGYEKLCVIQTLREKESRRPLSKESPTPNMGGGVFEKINYKSIK